MLSSEQKISIPVVVLDSLLRELTTLATAIVQARDVIAETINRQITESEAQDAPKQKTH